MKELHNGYISNNRISVLLGNSQFDTQTYSLASVAFIRVGSLLYLYLCKQPPPSFITSDSDVKGLNTLPRTFPLNRGSLLWDSQRKPNCTLLQL